MLHKLARLVLCYASEGEHYTTKLKEGDNDSCTNAF